MGLVYCHGVKAGFVELGSRPREIFGDLDGAAPCHDWLRRYCSDPDVVFLCSFLGPGTAGRGRWLRGPYQGTRV